MKAMSPVLILLVGSFLTCQALRFSEPAKHTPLKFTEIHAGARQDVNNVADALVHFALSANNITQTTLITELSDVIDVQLHALLVKLEEEAAISRIATSDTFQMCCRCTVCTRRCAQCGRSCCCTGHGGCTCISCSSQYNMTFEAVKTPAHSFDDVVKNWALESKEELRRTVKSFFATKLAPSNDHCCMCTSCSQKCRKCSPVALPCCCKGLVCACVFCPSGKIVMEADSVDFLGDKRANLNERMSLVDSLIDRILINLN